MSKSTVLREKRREQLGAIGPAVMDRAAALWVLDTVLRHQGGWPVTPCSCLLGMCGACDRGRHDQCLDIGRPPAWHASVETHITDRRGFVRYGGHSAVWLADRTCRYRCPCACPPAPVAPLPAEPRPEQLDLFAELAGAAT